MFISLFALATIAAAIAVMVFFAERHEEGDLEWYEAIPAMVLCIMVWPVFLVVLGVKGLWKVVWS